MYQSSNELAIYKYMYNTSAKEANEKKSAVTESVDCCCFKC